MLVVYRLFLTKYTRYTIMVYMDNIRDRIMKHATDYIFTYGIRGWNMNEFAAEVGITKRTLYKYVDSKETLVQHTLLDYIEQTQTTLMMYLEVAGSLEKGIPIMLRFFPELVTRMDAKIIKDIYKQYPMLEDAVIEKRELLTGKLVDYIKRLQNEGQIRLEVDAGVMIETMQALVLYHFRMNPESMKEKLEASLNMLIYGIKPTGGGYEASI